jgi:hypothetical protein
MLEKFKNEADIELFKLIKTQVELVYDSNWFKEDLMEN